MILNCKFKNCDINCIVILNIDIVLNHASVTIPTSNVYIWTDFITEWNNCRSYNYGFILIAFKI